MLFACSSPGSNASPSRSGSSPGGAPNPAASKAADLRTSLDVLLGEQVMIVAKESAAAVNHSEEYSGYTTLLTINDNDLRDLMRSAFGDTAAAKLWQSWGAENSYLVDYAIGVVTHNQTKADGASSGLVNTFVPQFAELVTTLTQLPQDSISQLMSQQVLEMKLVIDDEFAHNYAAAYTDLHTAYAQSRRVGDALAPHIAQRFPDKFPGDPAAQQVDSRVSLSTLFQENAYLSTMTTDSIAAGRGSEKAAAANALAASAAALGKALGTVLGNAAATRFDQVWAARDVALAGYASGGDAATRQALTQTFVSDFSSLAQVPGGLLADQVDATVRVIDDQRGKSMTPLAGDDRAAASAMQPIADALTEG